MVVDTVISNSNLILFSGIPIATASLGTAYSVYSTYARSITEINRVSVTGLLLLVLGLVLFVGAQDFWVVYTTTAEYGSFGTEAPKAAVRTVTAFAVPLALREIHAKSQSEAEVKFGSFKMSSQEELEEFLQDFKDRNEELEKVNSELEKRVSELEKENKELKERNNRLKERNTNLEVYGEMVNSVPDILFALDENWRFIEANQATSKTLGYNYEDILGLRFSNLMSEQVNPEIDIRSEEQKVLVEHKVSTNDGETYPIELHMARLPPTQDTSRGIVGMGRDITRRKEREQRLEVINRFFRHNIRNELTVVIGRAQMLIDKVSEENKENAEILLDRAEVLKDMSEKARVVGELLSGTPERRPVQVSETLERAVQEFEDEEVELRVDSPEDTQVRVIDGLHFAIENLVENAIEHNDIESPIVEINVSKEDGEVEIEVADNGSGIPENEIEVVQEGDEDALKHGSGIGLWAVNWIIQLSRGRLEFGESELGGASVKMTFQEHI